jgi:hypothetical protein
MAQETTLERVYLSRVIILVNIIFDNR